MDTILIVNILGYFLILALLGYYIITTLQWYSYKLERVAFHHTKSWWNIIYFLAPLLIYDFVMAKTHNHYGFIVALLYIILFLFWIKGVDKKLVFTGRVKRFFIALGLFGLMFVFAFKFYVLLFPLLFAYLASNLIEKILFAGFKNRAKEAFDKRKNLQVIGVTASYGKTSIKNYIATILSVKYRVYATPRSVNTLAGVIKDINEELPQDCEIYIVEMGARGKGDIAEISTFVEPHYGVVGKIGPAHIEYFKSLESVRNTKMELILSRRLKKVWVHKSANAKPRDGLIVFGDEIKNIEATLEQTCFEMDENRYCAKVLGEFNAMNLAVAVMVAKEFGLSEDEVARGLKKITATPHRLQRIDAGGKVILDDSFNGNIDGMLASFSLCRQFDGRKVLITPGLVEATEDLNREVAKVANEIFDLVIVTGELNMAIFREFIDGDKAIYLTDKSQLEETLQTQTYEGDLILFANDAPSFI